FVIAIAQPKRLARCNERFSHRLYRFGIECLTAQKRRDRRASFTLGLLVEIVEPLAKLKAARQGQPTLLHGEEILAQHRFLWLSGGFSRAIFRVQQAIADFLTQIVQHGVPIFASRWEHDCGIAAWSPKVTLRHIIL